MNSDIIQQRSIIVPEGKDIEFVNKKKPKIPNYQRIGNGTMNKHSIKSIDLLREVVKLSKPAQNTILWLKDELAWDNQTGEVKIEMKNLTNSQQQQFQKGYKELNSKNLMIRTRRSHYMMNPNALIPLDYEAGLKLWNLSKLIPN